MKLEFCFSTIGTMLDIIEKVNLGSIKREEIKSIVKHPDYQFEFERYKGRISEEEYIEYIYNLKDIKEEELNNRDFKLHHKYYIDLMENIEEYRDGYLKLRKEFNRELVEEQLPIIMNGLPDGVQLGELKMVSTIGIGGSFGYPHGNGMHFDFLQIIKMKSIEELCKTIAHEMHHVAMSGIFKEINFEGLTLEEDFCLAFVGEGLAVKYCNNAEGILSKSIYEGEKNTGLDQWSWEYLNNEFEEIMESFRNNINQIRNGEISSEEELGKVFQEYWMCPYTKDQDRNETPKLLHYRMYSLGNEIWGIIHDCFGKEKVFEVLRNMKLFASTYNEALKKIGKEEYAI